MENSKLEEDIKSMTEETAEALAKAFSDFNETAESFNEAFEGYMKVYAREVQFATARKFVDLVHRACCSTILTRWYWMRKARKCNDVLMEIINFNNVNFK